jgi:isocitrate dehydrogenase (NAD+)
MYKVALFKGDGIGPEITDAAIEVIEAAGVKIDWIPVPGGDETRRSHGTPMPDESILKFLDIGIGFKGPYTSTLDDPHIIPEWRKDPQSGRRPRNYNSPTNALRGEAGAYAQVRLAKSYPGISAPIQGLNVLIVRELSEDIMIAHEYTTQNGAAIAMKVITREGSERVIRFAFELARKEKRKKVSVIHKANVLKQTDGLFVRTGREVAGDFPDLVLEEVMVDSGAARFIEHPELYDVAVMPNQYGDILSDLASAVAGSLGLGGGATYGRKASLFEPVHGTAPDIAGQGVANPISQIMSGIFMLRHIRELDAAAALEKAVEMTLLDRRYHPRDLGGEATTRQVTEAIIGNLDC